MTLVQALRDFAREALVGLVRSLRVSLLAILTIAVTLCLAGAFYLATRNLEGTVHSLREEARFVVYLSPQADAEATRRLEERLRSARWVESIEVVESTAAERRFVEAFPSLAGLLEQGASASLPRSIEARMRPIGAQDEAALGRWSAELEADPAVELVDDDRDWIAQAGRALTLVRALGWVLSAVLVGASIFTIASVVRLTTYLYRDEIAVMRLVGATEFYIRGPFYLEGVFQGILGATIAALGLGAAHLALRPKLDESLLVSALAGRFFTPQEIAALLCFGALAGLIGAMVSLGREPETSELGS